MHPERSRLRASTIRQLGLLMRASQLLSVLILGLAACSSAPKVAAPPANFPDLSAFTAADPNDPRSTGTAFQSPEQITCVLDFGPQKAIVCSGNLRGLPHSVRGTGCPSVRKTSDSSDAPYGFEQSGPECASSRVMPLAEGRKMVGKNGTCAVGEGGLVACIDADNKHGFVLQPSGSWAF
jgi:hypothetical protein